ncbi:MAG: glycosyltransferase [Chitinophagales bacterium]|nr:glycosyltransferase [Chitinophagales bacterium]MCB9020766.1 glycosyltransferase [Chitinophagales bacterium]
MKRVLIISYYWPPVGGAGVQRWLKHARYLPDFGWKPIIYTPENPDLSITDESLLQDVSQDQEIWRTPIREPYDLYRKLVGKREVAVNHGLMDTTGKGGFFSRLGMWVRANAFIPDARMFWIRPSARYLIGRLKKEPVDAIISTGPPHSMHRIALQVHRATGIPWIADFRDPWTNNDVYHRLPLGKRAERIHLRMEKEVLRTATGVVTVSWQWAEDMKQISGREVEVITNGYDEADFSGAVSLPKDVFELHHVGSLYADRNPVVLWKLLGERYRSSEPWKKHLRIHLTGKTDQSVLAAIREAGLQDVLQYDDYLPHSEVIEAMRQAPVLLLLLNDAPDIMGRIPGKLFEYLAAGRPVLGIGAAAGDSARILNESKAGKMFDLDDELGMAAWLDNSMQAWLDGSLEVQQAASGMYSRRSCAKQYAELLNQV